MSKFALSPNSRWQLNDNCRTSASMIIGSSTPFSPTTRPKQKLQDLLKRRETQQLRQKDEEEPRRLFIKPFASFGVKEQVNSKLSPLPTGRGQQPDSLKKARPVLLQAHSSGDRVERREGELTSCKSEKTLPTFVRNRDKQPDKAKSKELSRENFKIIKRLGEGRFGTVFLVREVHTHFLYALKVMNKKKIIEDNLLTQFIRELKIQTFLEHPNIIRCYGSFSDHESFYAVLELGCDGQLFDIIAEGNTLSEESTSFIVGSLLDATSMMHKHKILHRDIKPENVVLVHGNIKLCDFGWAVNKKEELRSTFCGTPLYLSPELLQGEKYDEKVDLWAIGIMAYELHLGCSPFDISQQEDLHRIVTDEVKFPKKVSKEFKDFIMHILRKNPTERLPCKDLLKMDFIQKYKEMQSCEELCQ